MIRVILDTPYGLLLILLALTSSVHGTCPSTPGECVNETLFNQLSPGDPNYYCEEGAKLVATAQNCLRDCKVAEDQPQLVKFKTSVNKVCAQIEADCPNVCDTLVEQTRCYDKYKGLDAVITKIVTHFEAGLPLDCNEFSWGRYCQTTRNCTINKNLDNYLIKSNKIIGLGLAICGTEKLKSILPYLDEGDGCKLDIESSIINKCNISCPLANAESSTEICIQLEKQAKCLQEQTAGCTDAKRLYVLPRLNTYAIANKYLDCAIKFDGIKVQTAGRVIQYSDLINACMMPFLPIVESTLTPSNYGPLKQLFNFDTDVVNFCKSKGEQDTKIKNCKNAFLGSLTPQAKLLIRAEDEYASDNIKFLPKIGGFPLDHCGMAYIYNWLPEVCPKSLQWTTRLCVPSSDSTNNGPKSTEKPAAIGNGEEHHTKGTKADDYRKNSTGDMLPSVAVLAFTCLLGFALM